MFVEALELFKIMMVNPFVKPDNYTYPSVLKACGGLGRINDGKMLHAHLTKAGILSSDVVVTSSLVGAYAKCTMFNYAIQLFDEMLERDVACWNTVITCFYQDGQCEKALEMFDEMKKAGFEPDSVTFTTVLSACARLLDLERGKTIHGELMRSDLLYDDFVCSALVDMYGKCRCLEMAKAVFERMPQKSVVSWNSMVAGYSLQGDSVSCIDLFRRLIVQGVKPTLTTLSSLLVACSRSADLRRGKFVHGYIVRNNVEPDIFIGTTLIDLYHKCYCVQSADRVFEKMPKTNVVVWNVMISGYVTLGHYFEAFELFTEMRNVGVRPDAITLTSILTACSQLGTLGQGKEIHRSYIEGKLDSNEIVMGALLDMIYVFVIGSLSSIKSCDYYSGHAGETSH
ncbi:Pentatricopeptide repeat [Dillenia turbinata]|uniref:Pentatricopeptide repeat n=1 Tax=Dillenia turbinata TaxID=194707 RepID=A0AAN8V626_9MAGN